MYFKMSYYLCIIAHVLNIMIILIVLWKQRKIFGTQFSSTLKMNKITNCSHLNDTYQIWCQRSGTEEALSIYYHPRKSLRRCYVPGLCLLSLDNTRPTVFHRNLARHPFLTAPSFSAFATTGTQHSRICLFLFLGDLDEPYDCSVNCFVIPDWHWLALINSQWMIDTSCFKVFHLG